MKRLAALALAACVGCSPTSAAIGEVVELTIEHSRFVPEAIEVDEGSTVTFVIHNEDPIAHEFILGDDDVQLVHEQGTEKHHGDRPGEVSIPQGTTRSTTFTFTSGADLEFACHLPGHYDYGMRGAVEVR